VNDFLRREWGAVAFLVATALGIVVVPVGLNLNKRNIPAATESLVSASPSASPSTATSASPAVSPSSSLSPGPSPAATPSPSTAAASPKP
jgi:hypothetical protein